MSYHVVGLDPGGQDAFGWVVAKADKNLTIIAQGVRSDMPSAIEGATSALRFAPEVLGIDAPLFWIPCGDREADKHVRKLVMAAGGKAQTVGAVNSLRGACLAQGILAARAAKERWPAVRITEAHPKALLAVSAEAHRWVDSLKLEPEHVRDAALAAYSAFAFQEGKFGWKDLAATEVGAFFPSGSSAAYYFPESVST